LAVADGVLDIWIKIMDELFVYLEYSSELISLFISGDFLVGLDIITNIKLNIFCSCWSLTLMYMPVHVYTQVCIQILNLRFS